MQAGLRLCWSHIPHCWKSHFAAHLCVADWMGVKEAHVISTEISHTGLYILTKAANGIISQCCS